jgi:DNA-binding IclR family transcriptional regulator
MPTPEKKMPASESPRRPGRPKGKTAGPPAATGTEAVPRADLQLGAANSTADRAIDILLLFSDEKPVWSAGEIATYLNMPRSTTYRYLNSLRSYALIVEGQNGFHLGPRLFPLARVAKAQMSVVAVATPKLQALGAEFGEMVVLQQRVGFDIVALHRVESPQRVNLSSTRSHMLPWPATASAKLLLAFAPRTEYDHIMRAAQPTIYTSKTITSKAGLLRDLEQVRKRGYAITNEERDEGVWGVAAPVLEQGEVRYCIALAALKFRVTDKKDARLIEAVQRAAAEVSQELADMDF